MSRYPLDRVFEIEPLTTTTDELGGEGVVACLALRCSPDWFFALGGLLQWLTDPLMWEGSDADIEHCVSEVDKLLDQWQLPDCENGCTMTGARVYRTEDLNVPDNTNVPIPFDAERFDTGGYHDNVTNNTRLTAPSAGKYSITGHVEFSDSKDGFRVLYVRRNGDTYIAMDRCVAVSADRAAQLCVATICELGAGDYVELIAVQLSGGALTLRALAEYSPEFAIHQLS